MTANSGDLQRLWGPLDGFGEDYLAKTRPNDAAPVVYGDWLFSATSSVVTAAATANVASSATAAAAIIQQAAATANVTSSATSAAIVIAGLSRLQT